MYIQIIKQVMDVLIITGCHFAAGILTFIKLISKDILQCPKMFNLEISWDIILD
jgi:hypothetical protein